MHSILKRYKNERQLRDKTTSCTKYTVLAYSINFLVQILNYEKLNIALAAVLLELHKFYVRWRSVMTVPT